MDRNQPTDVFTENVKSLKLHKRDLVLEQLARTGLQSFSAYAGVYFLREFGNGNMNNRQLILALGSSLALYGLSFATMQSLIQSTRSKIKCLNRAIGMHLLEYQFSHDAEPKRNYEFDAQEAISTALEREREGTEEKSKWTIDMLKSSFFEMLQQCGAGLFGLFR